MKTALALIFSLLISFCFSQTPKNGKVSIAIVSPQNQPLENATVELLRSKDSSIVKTALTKDDPASPTYSST
jgi:iron complex outermembrane receptor protein